MEFIQCTAKTMKAKVIMMTKDINKTDELLHETDHFKINNIKRL